MAKQLTRTTVRFGKPLTLTILYPIALWPGRLLANEEIRGSGKLTQLDIEVDGLDTSSKVYYLAFPTFSRETQAAVIVEADARDAKACRQLAPVMDVQIANLLTSDALHCLADAMVQCKLFLGYKKEFYEGNWAKLEFQRDRSGQWRVVKMWACQGLPKQGRSNDIEINIKELTLETVKEQIWNGMVQEEPEESIE